MVSLLTKYGRQVRIRHTTKYGRQVRIYITVTLTLILICFVSNNLAVDQLTNLADFDHVQLFL